jgi:hypothetical protein
MPKLSFPRDRYLLETTTLRSRRAIATASQFTGTPPT